VRVEESEEDDSVLQLPVAPTTSYSERVKSSPEFAIFKEKYTETLDDFKDCLNDVVHKNVDIDTTTLLDSALDIIGENTSTIGIFDMLHNMRQYDDSTHAHCLNVALICNVFGKWLNMTPEQIELATLCGLLHDIGKLMIPNSIITKPGKLSDEEFAIIKKHPGEGYRILMNAKLDPHICNSALMHHEKCDGSGYPLGITSDKIDRYAKAVAIADVYDAMTSARIYRGSLCPFRVIEIFESEGLQKYDPEYILTFLENIVNTYLHNEVRLSNGETGTVVFINKHLLSKPVVKQGDKFLDLSKEPDLHIDAIL